MSIGMAALEKTVADLRQEFDGAFAAPLPGAGEGRESLISLRAAGEGLAVRTMHITGLAKRRRIVPVPSTVPGLLGIMGFRGALLPAYDLAALLGLQAAAGGAWLLLANPESPIGLVFDEFEGQVEIEPAGLYESEAPRSRRHLRTMARVGTGHRAVIDIPGILAQIRKTAAVLEPAKE
jgi:purine-binding chemotaxis protein CheW